MDAYIMYCVDTQANACVFKHITLHALFLYKQSMDINYHKIKTSVLGSCNSTTITSLATTVLTLYLLAHTNFHRV